MLDLEVIEGADHDGDVCVQNTDLPKGRNLEFNAKLIEFMPPRAPKAPSAGRKLWGRRRRPHKTKDLHVKTSKMLKYQ
jgi:hypothetical protein